MKDEAVTSPRKTGRPLSFDRDAALREAMLAFWRSGYESTSIADLTAAMDLTPPSLYTAFGDKKRLFLEAMQLYAGSPEDFEARLSQAPTAQDAATAMLLSAADAFTDPSMPKGCLLASATATGSVKSADVIQAVAEIRERMRLQLQARIEADVARGMLPAQTDAHLLSITVIALIQGLSVLARDGHGRDVLRKIARTGTAAWPKYGQSDNL